MRRAAYKARRKQREERAARELEAAQLRQRLDAYEAKKQAEYAALYDNRQRPAEEVQPPTKEEAELVAHMEKWNREPPRPAARPLRFGRGQFSPLMAALMLSWGAGGTIQPRQQPEKPKDDHDDGK